MHSDVEELKSIIKSRTREYINFDGLDDQKEVFVIDSCRGLFLEFDSEMVTIVFSDFEQCFYSFNYDSVLDYATAVADYIKMLLTHRVRVIKIYRDNRLVKMHICIQTNSGWKKIASNSVFSLGCFLKKTSKVCEDFFYQQQ